MVAATAAAGVDPCDVRDGPSPAVRREESGAPATGGLGSAAFFLRIMLCRIVFFGATVVDATGAPVEARVKAGETCGAAAGAWIVGLTVGEKPPPRFSPLCAPGRVGVVLLFLVGKEALCRAEPYPRGRSPAPAREESLIYKNVSFRDSFHINVGEAFLFIYFFSLSLFIITAAFSHYIISVDEIAAIFRHIRNIMVQSVHSWRLSRLSLGQ